MNRRNSRTTACFAAILAVFLIVPRATTAREPDPIDPNAIAEAILGLVGLTLADVAGQGFEEANGTPPTGSCDVEMDVDVTGSGGALLVDCTTGDMIGTSFSCSMGGDTITKDYFQSCGGSSPFGMVALTGETKSSSVSTSIIPIEDFLRQDSTAFLGAKAHMTESDGFLRTLRQKGKDVSEARGLSIVLPDLGGIWKRRSMLEVVKDRKGGTYNLCQRRIFPLVTQQPETCLDIRIVEKIAGSHTRWAGKLNYSFGE